MDEGGADTAAARGGMGGGRTDVGLGVRTQPWGGGGELDGHEGDIVAVATGEEVDGTPVEQSRVVRPRLRRRPRSRGAVDRWGGAVGELDLAQGGDRVEVVRG